MVHLDTPLLSSSIRILILILSLTVIQLVGFQSFNHHSIVKAQESKYPEVGQPSSDGPLINDPNFRAEVVFKGLRYPTSMAFLGPDDILVTEKDSGTVRRIINSTILPQPLIDVNVATYGHRGLLGIAISSQSEDQNMKINKTLEISPSFSHSHTNLHYPSTVNTIHVFLYYTEAATHDGDDTTEGKEPLGNRLYRYDLVNNKLSKSKTAIRPPSNSRSYR